MLELPEAVVQAQQIRQALEGRRIAKAVADYSKHAFAWYTGNPSEYDGMLAGKTIRHAAPVGGNVEILADDMVLAISVGMKYHAPGEKRPQKHQLLLEFDDASAVSATVHMWGVLLCFKQGEQGGMKDYYLAKNQPSPLSDEFDRAFFDTLFDAETPKLSAKAFLATEQRIPGLGNGVLQDILWTAKIHPKRKMVTLSADERDRMYEAVKSVLDEMARRGGRDTERDLFGRPGGYATALSKNTVGTACPACGSIIRKEAYLGGSIYYCPGCQTD